MGSQDKTLFGAIQLVFADRSKNHVEFLRSLALSFIAIIAVSINFAPGASFACEIDNDGFPFNKFYNYDCIAKPLKDVNGFLMDHPGN